MELVLNPSFLSSKAERQNKQNQWKCYPGLSLRDGGRELGAGSWGLGAPRGCRPGAGGWGLGAGGWELGARDFP